MLKLLLLILAVTLSSSSGAQNSSAKPVQRIATEDMTVKDSSGTVYSTKIWQALIATGRYSLKAEKPGDKSTAFLLVRLSDEEYEKKMKNLPKPKESSAFKPGEEFDPIKARDINNDKINTKKMSGKILVINFWFINCPPCVMEMPELNKIVDLYKNDSNIVFLSVALDNRAEIKSFLKKNPFRYKIIDDGRSIASGYNVASYPTNIVVSPEGKVHFSTSGYAGVATIEWIKRSIEELKKQPQVVVISSE